MDSPVCIIVHDIAIHKSCKTAGILSGSDLRIRVNILVITTSRITCDTAGTVRCHNGRIFTEGVIDNSITLNT